MGWLARAWHRFRNPHPVWRITVNDEGLSTWCDDEPRRTVHWNDVTAIHTYKQDLFVHDCICLEFTFENQAPLSVSEEMEGFKEIFDLLHERFDISPEWYMRVMFPVFEMCEDQLWKREDREQGAGTGERV